MRVLRVFFEEWKDFNQSSLVRILLWNPSSRHDQDEEGILATHFSSVNRAEANYIKLLPLLALLG